MIDRAVSRQWDQSTGGGFRLETSGKEEQRGGYRESLVGGWQRTQMFQADPYFLGK